MELNNIHFIIPILVLFFATLKKGGMSKDNEFLKTFHISHQVNSNSKISKIKFTLIDGKNIDNSLFIEYSDCMAKYSIELAQLKTAYALTRDSNILKQIYNFPSKDTSVFKIDQQISEKLELHTFKLQTILLVGEKYISKYSSIFYFKQHDEVQRYTIRSIEESENAYNQSTNVKSIIFTIITIHNT